MPARSRRLQPTVAHIIKFTLRKIYIRYMDGFDRWENEYEVVADVPSEGDIADIIAKALATFLI
jgi:hypothetical protein